MRKIIKRNWFPIVILLILSLIPLFWYKPGTIALGHDMGWSLIPIERFLDRFYTWSLTGFGNDHSLYVGSITFYSIEAFFSLFNMSFDWVQKSTFIFWFFAMYVAMYYCCRVIYQGKYSRLLALLAAVFYTVNHFTLHDWLIAEFSKFSAMIYLPLMIAIIWQTVDKKMSLKVGLFLNTLFILVFNGGGGSGIPVMGGVLISAVVLFFYKLIVEKKPFFNLVKIYFLFIVFSIFVNMYWIFPLLHIQSNQFAQFQESGGASVTVGWTNVVSKNASFLNLFRLQGFSSWYDEPSHPYAGVFLNNPLMIFISILFPVIAFSSYLLARDKTDRKIVVFFILLLLFSIFFTAGTHPPLGFIYKWMMEHLYGFAIFRTAFYKFGYALWFSYAFLIAYSLTRLSSVLRNKILMYSAAMLYIILIFYYSFPFFIGSFFAFKKPFNLMIKLPQYVQDSVTYVNTLPEDARILLVPPPSPTNGQSDVYNFGYFSRTPLPYQITQRSIVSNVEVNTERQENLTEQLYGALLREDVGKTKQLISDLGITHLLIRNDVMVDNPEYPVEKPDSYVEKLKLFPWIKKTISIGAWDFYSVELKIDKFSLHQPNISIVYNGRTTDVDKKNIQDEVVLIPQEYKSLFPDNKNEIFIAECQNCTHSEKIIGAYDTLFLPTSPFYLMKENKENKILNNSKNNNYAYLRLLLQYSLDKALQLNVLADRDRVYKGERLDQQQRSRFLTKYINQVKEIPEVFKKLDNFEQTRLVPELYSILNTQSEIIDNVRDSNFFTEVKSEYYSIFDTVNSILEDKELLKLKDYEEKNWIYSQTLGEERDYRIYAENAMTSTVLLDEEQFTFGNVKRLEKGKHKIAVPIVKNNIMEREKITVGHTSVEIVIPKEKLKKLQEYVMTYDLPETAINGIVEVYDEFGNRKYSGSMRQGIKAIFSTGADVKDDYKIIFRLKGKELKREVLVSNLKITETILPRVILKSSVNLKKSSLPNIKSSYIDPTRVNVSISDAKDPYILIFKQSYSSAWTASINGVDVDRHFPSNADFNAWYIDKKGDYNVSLRFKVQENYVRGGGISILTLLSLATFLLITQSTKKWKR